MLKGPIKVGFELITRCNRRCNFCEPAHVVTDYYSNVTTPIDKCFEIIDKLADNEIYEIFLTGGEPTLRKDLPEIISRCIKKDVIPTLSTNAEVINEEMARNLKKVGADLYAVQVSLEGVEKVNDEITNSNGGFKRSIKGIKNLLSNDFDVIISSVATKDVLPSIPKLLEWLHENEVNFRFYRVLRYMPFSLKGLELMPSKELIIKTYNEIRKLSKENNFGVELEYPPGIVEHSNDSRFHSYFYLCKAGKIQFDILPDGSVVPCKALKRSDFIVGNIFKQEIDELWNSHIMKLFRELTPDKYYGRCGECDRKEICYSCRAIAYNLTGDLYGDDISCYKLKETYETGHQKET